MLTKMCNPRSSGYPLMDVAEDGVDGVISLDCLVDSWVWRSWFFILLVLIICISPLIIAIILRWLIYLIFSFINLSLILILSW
jgi:sensor histidine kinase YesM